MRAALALPRALAFMVSILALPAAAWAEETPSAQDAPARPWAFSLYGGIGTDGGIEDIPGLEADFNDAYMLSAGLSRELWRWRDRLALEAEVNLAQHFNKQDHSEVNLLLAARWMEFPWNHRVRTSLAVGDGLSFASSIPDIELERSPGKNSRLLNYLMIEAELAPPGDSPWSFVARLHHRSGIFGLFNNVSLGSNIVAAGVRYRF